MKQKDLIERSNLPAPLIRAVVRQLGGWMLFEEQAPDIANHGIDGGFCGFIYHTDTVNFTRRHKTAILASLQDLACDIGEGLLELIAGFHCLKDYALTVDAVARALHTGKGGDVTQIYNALAWYAAEEVARAYMDLKEEA